MKNGLERPLGSVSISAIAVLALFAATVAAISLLPRTDDSFHPLQTDREAPLNARISALSAHSTIWISSNAGFTNASGVVSGSGSADDPYVIAEWDINASAADGIRVFNTDAHFVIRDCYIHDGSPSYVGIYLIRCSNGTVINNTCTNDMMGIFSYLTDNDTLQENTCTQCDEGIRLYDVETNDVIRNKCVDNDYGTVMMYPRNLTIDGNNFSSNAVNGAYITNSDSICVFNNTVGWNGNDGLLLTHSGNSTLWNNSVVSNGEAGIVISSSSNMTAQDCMISDNDWYGLAIYGTDSSNNRIWNNTFHHNRFSGDTYNPSANQAFDEGASNRWNSSDGYGNFWSDLTGPDLDGDGIVDVPYPIWGAAGSSDEFPRTLLAPIPEFGVIPVVAMTLATTVLLVRRGIRRKDN